MSHHISNVVARRLLTRDIGRVINARSRDGRTFQMIGFTDREMRKPVVADIVKDLTPPGMGCSGQQFTNLTLCARLWYPITGKRIIKWTVRTRRRDQQEARAVS